jgi:methylmalonyl-CoA decarboxylase subunit alpha
MASKEERWAAILAQLGAQRAAATAMGGAERVARHRASGKLDARERAHALFDPGSFYEIGAFAAALTPEAPAADALVAGFGLIGGRPALAGIEDFTVMGGSIGDAGADKRYRLTQLAAQERVPLVFLREGAGHRPVNAHTGRRPNDLQGLAALSGQVPIVCGVLGASAGHGALAAPLSDFVVMTQAASLFAAGPPIVKAAIGEVISKEELGGPTVHLRSGLVHNLAADDAEAIAMLRAYLAYFPDSAWQVPPRSDGTDCGPRRLEAILELIDPDPGVAFDAHALLSMLVDGATFFEVQPRYGASLITALAHLGGHSVALVANNPAIGAGAVDAAAAAKAAHFMEVAGAFHLPVVFLTDNPGVMPGSAAERAGTLRHAARMFAAQHRLSVPKLHVTLRKAFGFGSSLMAMNPFDAQTLALALPAATLGAMPAEGGAEVAKLDADTRARLGTEQSGGALHVASRLAFDDIIDPRELRNALIRGLQLAGARLAEAQPSRRGITP